MAAEAESASSPSPSSMLPYVAVVVCLCIWFSSEMLSNVGFSTLSYFPYVLLFSASDSFPYTSASDNLFGPAFSEDVIEAELDA